MKRALVSVVIVSALFVGAACKKSSETPVSTKCASDSDCVLFCEARKGCCGDPCTDLCKHAVHKDEMAAIQQYNRDNCTDADRKQCPTVGACMPLPPNEAKVKAVCNAGTCRASGPQL